jgi:redox-sensitive bicupin YhaK (pirin superfamily)
VQWITAGGGIVHAEMFPLFDPDGPNTLHLFQIWLNLPAANKMVDPNFSMFWDHEIPRHTEAGVEVTVIAGRLGQAEPLQPPPDSWASAAESDVAIWHVRLDSGARWTPPTTSADSSRMLYLFEGQATIAGQAVANNTGVVLDAATPAEVTAEGGDAEFLILQGRAIGEPVAQYGPFVLNDEAGIRQAMADYQETQFGGWPWPDDDPVHGPTAERFARHADGRVEAPA